jgi:asparagine synthase (glutamine-hydrolysing)
MPEAYTRSVSYWAEPDKLARSAGLARTVDDTLAGMQAVESDPLRWMMYRDSQTYLPDDILTKVDRAAMSVSLETRVPLLDHSVVEFAWAVPTALHYGDGRGKYLLRKLLERYLPPALIDRPKQGFAVPLADWLRGPLRGWAGDLLDGARLRREGWLDDRPIQRRWRAFLAGEEGHALALWGVLMFEAWLDQADR